MNKKYYDTDNNINSDTYIKIFESNYDTINNEIKFPMFFIEFCKSIENTLFEYKKIKILVLTYIYYKRYLKIIEMFKIK